MPRWYHHKQHFAFLSYKLNKFHAMLGKNRNRSHKMSKCDKNVNHTLTWWLFMRQFFVLTTFWPHLRSISEQTYSSMESICLTPQIKFVILLTVNHTIHILFREFSIGSTNYPQIDIFLYSCHLSGWYCIDIVRRNSVLVTYGS